MNEGINERRTSVACLWLLQHLSGWSWCCPSMIHINCNEGVSKSSETATAVQIGNGCHRMDPTACIANSSILNNIIMTIITNEITVSSLTVCVRVYVCVPNCPSDYTVSMSGLPTLPICHTHALDADFPKQNANHFFFLNVVDLSRFRMPWSVRYLVYLSYLVTEIKFVIYDIKLLNVIAKIACLFFSIFFRILVSERDNCRKLLGRRLRGRTAVRC